MTEESKVNDGQVVSMHYTLQVDDRVADSSEGGEPLEFIQGMGHILPGLEKVLYDLKVGDARQVVVSAADGYGEVDDQAFMDVPRQAFPPDVPLQIGTEMELRDQSDHPVYARIEQINGQDIHLNMNHPLAGKDLHFSVRITGLRSATDEEISHGHVHEHDHGQAH